MYEKFVYEIAAVDLSKIYFQKNPKKTCKPNNHDLNRDWKKTMKLKKKKFKKFEKDLKTQQSAIDFYFLLVRAVVV